MPDNLFGGLDFGISTASLSIINRHKELVYSKSVSYQYSFRNPNSWIDACKKLLAILPIEVKRNLNNLAISSTSGNLNAYSLKGEPLGKAIPYEKACSEYSSLIDLLTHEEENLKNPYSSFSKALQLIDKYGANILIRNQSDWITGWFLKDWTYGEESSNSILGWDPIKESWPKTYLNKSLKKCLPQIIKSGKVIGQVNSGLAESFKLNKKLILIAGTTDYNASLLAAGLGEEDGLTILGTTIAVKKIIDKPINKQGTTTNRFNGKWIFGETSNIGYGILSEFFSDLEIKELSRQINPSKNTSLNLLPLNSKGGRFPIKNSNLEAILGSRPVSDSLYLHALLEGLAKIELQGWEKLYELTGSLPKKIITMGRGTKNPQWRKIREKTINIPIVTCNKTISFGTALLSFIQSENLLDF